MNQQKQYIDTILPHFGINDICHIIFYHNLTDIPYLKSQWAVRSEKGIENKINCLNRRKRHNDYSLDSDKAHWLSGGQLSYKSVEIFYFTEYFNANNYGGQNRDTVWE